MPSAQIVELLTFGGVDARSNPLAMPFGKCLRVQNWCPQPGGYIKQRYGFSSATYFGTLTPGYKANSAYYFGIDEEATGATPTVQGVIFGYQGDGASSGSVKQVTLGDTPTITEITPHSDGLPFSIYQQDNKIYIPCGDVEAGSFDDLSSPGGFAQDGGGDDTWNNPDGILGSGSYATITIPVYASPIANPNNLQANAFTLPIPFGSSVTGIVLSASAYATDGGGGGGGGSSTATPATFGTATAQIFRQNSWINPNNALGTTSYATVSLNGNDFTSYQSSFLEVFGFDFSAIPGTATIYGIVVSFQRYKVSGKPAIIDDMVTLLGVGAAQNKANSFSNWPAAPQTVTYGNSSDKWNVTPTVAQLQSPGFGIRVGCECDVLGSPIFSIAAMNSFTVTVYYSSSGGGGGGVVSSLSVSLTNGSSKIGTPKVVVLGAAPDTITLGAFNDNWGASISSSLINAQQLGIQIEALADGDVGSTETSFIQNLSLAVGFLRNGSADTWFTDGFTARRSGIRAPLNIEASSVTAGSDTTSGDWIPTQFTGYQLYMAYFNPNTGHVGNRFPIADRIIISAISLAITAAATSVGGVTVYTGTITGGGANALRGQSFTIQGFTASPGNNGGPFVCVGSSSTTLSLQNVGGFLETATASATNNSNSGKSVVVTGLPDLSSVNPEWVKLIGRTGDGGEIPYAIENPLTGDWVTVPNAATATTLTVGDVDFTSELPFANGLPPLMHKTATALGRVYGIDDTNPTLIDFSESASDIYGSANFVGLPPQSWNPLNQIPNPIGEGYKCIQSVDNEIWGFSKNFLSIITELGLYSPDGNPSPYVRKTLPGGCPGQRAFCQRENSPFWLSSKKQLLTRGAENPQSVSGEYEAALLAKLIDSELDSVEVIYHYDPLRFIDRIYICGAAYDPSRVDPQSPFYIAVFVHDFALGGVGYEYDYNLLFPVIFIRDPTSTYSFRDANQSLHLLFVDNAVSSAPIFQMEEGALDDVGSTISSDMIGIVNLGAKEPKFAGIDISGDSNLVVTHTRNLRLTLPELNSLTPDENTLLDRDDNQCGRFRVDIDEGAEYMLLRMRLDSHPEDAPANGLDLNYPPHVPLELYGRVYVLRNEIGATREVGGLAP